MNSSTILISTGRRHRRKHRLPASRLLSSASSIALLVVAIISSAPAAAADVTVVGTGGRGLFWQFGESWDTGVMPGAGDRAIFGPHTVGGVVVGSNPTRFGFNSAPAGILDIGSVWITPDSALTNFNNEVMPALRFHGTNGIAALNESNNVVVFFRRSILANDLIFRASNTAGGGFDWRSAIVTVPFIGLDLAGHTATFDTVNAANTMNFSSIAVISGAGNIVKTGAGTLSIGSKSTYTGSTTIADGTLALFGDGGDDGSIASSSRVIADGAFDISALSGTGTSIQSLAGSGAVTLGTKNLTITNADDLFSGIISGAGGLTLSGGTQALSGANGYLGATTVSGGTLRAAAANTFSGDSAFSVLSGGTLDLSGFAQTVASLDNAGIVSLGGAPGTVLTVAGNYVGNGGAMQLNARLGNDSSPTDLLRVEGDTSGSTLVRVNNIGGTGAQTVDGIKVIDVGGASTGSFTLQGDYVFNGEQAVIAGAYGYTLHQNGVNTPADGDWYLRSALVNPPPEEPSGPLYQPGVGLYESYPQILLQLMRMPTLRQRIGERDTSEGYGADARSEPGSAWWGRFEGSRSNIEPGSSTAGAVFDADQARFQAGFDALLLENANGRLTGGVTLQYGTAAAHVKSRWGNGDIDTDGYGLGGTLTWHGSDGFYVDGQAQVNWFDTDIRSNLAGAMVRGDGAVGYGASLEIGKRFAISGPWALIPQAQLAYTKTSIGFTDDFGANVSSSDGDSLLGRLGLALDYSDAWDGDAGPARSDLYGIANVYHEFSGNTSVDVSGVSFDSEPKKMWGSLGFGGTYSWGAEKYALYGEASVDTSLDGFGDSYSLAGKAGIRFSW